MIDDMKQKFPAGDGPIPCVEFQRKFGFREGFNVVVQAFPHFAPALLQIVQVEFWWGGRKAFRVREFGEREQLPVAKLGEPDALRIVDMAQRSRDATWDDPRSRACSSGVSAIQAESNCWSAQME